MFPENDDQFFVTRNIKGEQTKVVMDPRPDLGDGVESMCWAELLAAAHGINRQLAYALHGFRSQGTRLVKGVKGWVIRPEIGEKGWESQEIYDKYKEKYLESMRRDVILALKRIN